MPTTRLTLTKLLLVFAGVWAAADAKAQISYTTFDDPLGVQGTFPAGIFGPEIVGRYIDGNSNSHGFLFDGNNFSTLDFPNALATHPLGVYDNDIVGY